MSIMIIYQHDYSAIFTKINDLLFEATSLQS